MSEFDKTNFSRKSAVHDQAYSSVAQIFKERVIERNKIVPLTEVQEFLKELALKREKNLCTRYERYRMGHCESYQYSLELKLHWLRPLKIIVCI